GHNPMDLKRGIDLATNTIIEKLRSMSKKIDTAQDIANVGTISANNDKEIGTLISEAMTKVGKEGVITIEESKTAETSLDVDEGMQFDRVYVYPYFVPHPERMAATFESPYLLITDTKI